MCVPLLVVEDRRHLVVPECRGAEVGLDAVESFERGTVDGRVEGRVVPELGGRKPPAPVMWVVVDRAPQVHLHGLIDPLTLPVRLGVV